MKVVRFRKTDWWLLLLLGLFLCWGGHDLYSSWSHSRGRAISNTESRMWRYISRLQSALDTMEVEAPPRSLEEANRAVAREYGKESILTVDAWGNGYQYGVLQEGEFRFMTLTSHGPDGSPGTEDDIVVRVRFWEDLDDGSCLGGNYTMSMGRVHRVACGRDARVTSG